jgi:hypothetical protein
LQAITSAQNLSIKVTTSSWLRTISWFILKLNLAE